ncbi:MAG: glycosyltransferase family 2 protein [Marinibacterium sp.]|nr:glycosyltransferase family 2 protein [Marinibacterium sp.]
MGLSDRFRAFKRQRRLRAAKADLAARHGDAKPHGLPCPLILSLTSYPGRYGDLALTLRGLMTQTMRPDAVVLWVTPQDMTDLPPDVLALRDQGLEIAPCPDMRSYDKILPALAAHPDAAIITADDDQYYPADMVEALVDAHRASATPVIAHRAHEVRCGADGLPLSYTDWNTNLRAPMTGPLVFPTGASGVFYAPNSLPPETSDADLIQRLCPHGDDIWLYWMRRLHGGEAEKIGGRIRILEWQAPEAEGLRQDNLRGGNDRQIRAMIDHFGWPGT